MTLKAEWESYLRRVFDQPPSLVQQTETQRAFYAGAAAMFSLFLATTEVTEDEGEAALDTLQAELTAYAARIGRSDELSPLPPEIEAQYEIKDADIQTRLRTLGDQIRKGLPKGWAFTLFLFTLGEGGSMFYLSSAERTSMLEALHEFIARQIPRARGH
jgi:hypothetical protein